MEGIYVSFTEHKFTAFSSIWTVSCLSVCETVWILFDQEEPKYQSHSGKVKANGHEPLQVAKHQRGSLPTPYAYISTCTYILVQISSATSLQANLFTHCALVSTEQFLMRVNWKMPFCCQWECCVRRVWFSLHQLDPETVKPVSSSTLD